MWRRCTVRSAGTHRSENAGKRGSLLLCENPVHHRKHTIFKVLWEGSSAWVSRDSKEKYSATVRCKVDIPY